jgi:hypothetical protein
MGETAGREEAATAEAALAMAEAALATAPAAVALPAVVAVAGAVVVAAVAGLARLAQQAARPQPRRLLLPTRPCWQISRRAARQNNNQENLPKTERKQPLKMAFRQIPAAPRKIENYEKHVT